MSEFADGPAMQALTEKQRLFVLAHAANPLGKGADWARQAGYSDGKGKNCAVIAVTLLRHPGVVEAMFEVSRLAFRAKGPAIAADALLRIAQPDGHKDQARAAIAVMDRAGMGPLQNIHVEHHHSMNEGEMIARIKELAARNGMDSAKLLGTNTQTIDGEFVEVTAPNGPGGE
jgi:phage terminase small subunit